MRLEESRRTQEHAIAAVPAIVVRDVVRRFDSVRALDGATFDVPAGSLCGLIGPNGAGKTTLLSILATLDDDFSGDVRVLGNDVRHGTQELRRRMGFVPDHTHLYEGMAIASYLTFFASSYAIPRRKRQAAVDEVIALCGLEPLLGRPASGLSKGNTQRVAVARALLHHPKVLLLDEPASGLDPRARAELKQLLKVLSRRGVTVLLSSHILTELGDFCDRIVVVERGRVVASGPVAELIAGASSSTGVARVLMVEVDHDAAGAAVMLQRRPDVVTVDVDGGLLRVSLDVDEASAIAAIATDLVAAGYGLLRLAPERPSLEALFLTLTHRDVS